MLCESFIHQIPRRVTVGLFEQATALKRDSQDMEVVGGAPADLCCRKLARSCGGAFDSEASGIASMLCGGKSHRKGVDTGYLLNSGNTLQTGQNAVEKHIIRFVPLLSERHIDRQYPFRAEARVSIQCQSEAANKHGGGEQHGE